MRTLPFEEEIGGLDDLDQARRFRRRVRRIPYDYVAKFRLTGERNRVIPATINISAEAWFIAMSIGYSLEEPEELNGPVEIGRAAALSPTRFLRALDLSAIARGLDADRLADALATEQLALAQLQNIREALSFKYAIIDRGSGRELQNEAIHNLAGLGKADGTRPFRELAVPYVFAPNSTVVIELTELPPLAKGGIVHMVFQGYKEFR